MNVKTEGLADTLKLEVEKVLRKDGVRECLDHNKIMIMVTEEVVKTKIVEPVVRTKKPPRLEPELQEKIKSARKILKGKADSLYLFTLLVSLQGELKKVNISKLDIESRQVIVPVLAGITSSLGKLMLGVKNASIE